MIDTLFIGMILAYGFGASAALVFGRGSIGRWLVAIGSVLGAGAGLAIGIAVIAAGTPVEASIPGLFSFAGGLRVRLDSLGAFFLILIGLGAIPTALYGASYSKTYEDGRGSLRQLGLMLNLFLFSMSLVVLAGNIFTFLFAWECMSLTSYFLVITEANEPETLGAGSWYLGMAHISLVFLTILFLLLSGGDWSASFNSLRSGAAALSSPLRNVLFVLALIGFGLKAGIVPLHVWLPMAHPVAPSHVSALMSGVLIKMGIYGLLRVVLDLLGGGPAWWGGVVLGVGSVSAVLGVLYALMEHDLKRLLAFHSVENIGIILIGIGAGLIFRSYGLITLALLGFIGGLYHTLNHAVFKGLLFLGAGSVLHATHTRNMEKMGGLIKRMPWTAFFFLIGAAAISALPPLNGFVSEWLVFQALLGGFQIPKPEMAIIMPLAVGMLALTSGLAAACFVKAFGITFLAIPRSPEAEQAHESSWPMRLGMGVFAVLCVALGVLPFAVVPQLSRVMTGLGGLPASPAAFSFNLTLQSPAAFGQMSPPIIALGLVVILGLIPVGMRIFRINQKRRVSGTWACGQISQTPRMEYTATAFAEPLRRVFAQLFRPTKELSIDFHPDSKYFVQSIEYRSEILPWFERFLYHPILEMFRFTARHVRRLQSGSLHLYLLYTSLALVLLLVAVRWIK